LPSVPRPELSISSILPASFSCPFESYFLEMSLNDVWDSAVGSPFEPAIGKNSQLVVGSVLLFLCKYLIAKASARTDATLALMLTGYFSLSKG
jgi:hypothetical protein